MPNILLTHPDHGTKFALSDAEVEHDEKHGWVRHAAVSSVKELPRKGVRKTTAADQPFEETITSTGPLIESPAEVPAFLNSPSDDSEGE